VCVCVCVCVDRRGFCTAPNGFVPSTMYSFGADSDDDYDDDDDNTVL